MSTILELKNIVDSLIEKRGYAYTAGYLESTLHDAISRLPEDAQLEFISDLKGFVSKVDKVND